MIRIAMVVGGTLWMDCGLLKLCFVLLTTTNGECFVAYSCGDFLVCLKLCASLIRIYGITLISGFDWKTNEV